ncbi:hypothetical protein GE061_001960 [Apolygus lucorum]|uniref:Ionotropic glutamate receptor C-terminal domain-containing protein n=1 Tax=Apolygus lucorum TaxID=248454 RepID=A0A8S9X5H2_APOLU|nr:hypothetical protein GE061_001960 [Apolygus lucorum]
MLSKIERLRALDNQQRNIQELREQLIRNLETGSRSSRSSRKSETSRAEEDRLKMKTTTVQAQVEPPPKINASPLHHEQSQPMLSHFSERQQVPQDCRSYWGLDWKVFEAVADGMELTTKLVELPPTPSEDVTGQYDNGTWKGGILGNLDNGLIDTGFCGFAVERKKFSKNIVLGNSIRDTCLLYAVLHPKPNSEDWSVIFYSFDPTVHLCLGISIISFALIVQSIAHVDLFQSNSTSGFKSIGYSLSVAWGILMQGNFPNPWRMGTLRPFLFLWALFSILMTTSFSSHLVSNFARPPYHPKPRSVEDLVKFGYESPQIDSYPLSSIIDPDDPNSHEWLNRIYLVKDHSQLVDILDTKPLQALFGFKYDDDVFIPYRATLVIFVVFAIDWIHGGRMMREMEMVTDGEDVLDILGDRDFRRSVFYVFPENFNCISFSGDTSIFHEKLAAVTRHFKLPFVMTEGKHSLNCNATFVSVEDIDSLRKAISSQTFWGSPRFYYLVHNSSFSRLEQMFLGNTSFFKEAEVAITLYKRYKQLLIYRPPLREMKLVDIPKSGYWPKTDTTLKNRKEIRFTTGNCDMHSVFEFNGSDYNIKGLEWRIFSAIITKMGLKSKFVPTTEDFFLGNFNGTWSGGMLGSVVDNVVDVGFCSFWIEWRKSTPGLQMSNPYKKSCVTYMVRRPKVAAHSTISSFSPPVTAMMIITIVTASTVMNYLTRSAKYWVSSTYAGYRSWSHCLVAAWGMFVQANYPTQSRELGSIRPMVFILATFSLIMTASFSSQLILNFSSPSYTRMPKNLKELVDFGYSDTYFGPPPYPWTGVLDMNDPYSMKWIKRSHSAPNFTNLVHILKTKQKRTFIGTMYRKKFFMPMAPFLIPHDVMAQYEVMDSCIGNVYQSFAFQQGSPFIPSFNRYMSVFLQHGMVRKAIIALFIGTSLGDVSDMYQVIKGYVKLTEDFHEPFEILFRYAFTGYRCIQVISDHSAFGEYAMEHIYHSFGMPPITRGYFDEIQGCEGFVFLVETTEGVIPLIRKYPLFAEHRFLIILPDQSHKKILSLEKNIHSFGDAEILITTTRNLSVAYRLGQPERKQFEIIDEFQEPWEVEEVILDFKGRTIKVLTYNCSLFSQIGPLNKDKSTNYTAGAETDVFVGITESLNLKIEWEVLKDMPVHAIFFSKNKWFAKPLIEKKVDIAYGGLTITQKMLIGDIDLSPSLLLCFRFLVPRPKVIQAQWNSIFTVFAADVWVTIGLALLITTMILQRVTTHTRKYIHTEGIDQYTKLGGSGLQLLSIMVLADVPPSTELQGACRYILSFWSFSAMVITTIFSSGLVSHLTSQHYSRKIDTVEELIDRNFKWGFIAQPDFSELLNTKGNLLHARLRVRAKRMKDQQDHIDHLKRGKQFLWGAQVYNQFFLPEEDLPPEILANFEVADDCFIKYYIAYAFRPGSPYLGAYNQIIKTYTETGLMKKDFSRVLQSYARRYPYSLTVLQLTTPKLSGGSLKLYHLTGIIGIWGLGLGIAIVVFILEMLQKCHI